jgi:predicted GNAT family acetyltransferase
MRELAASNVFSHALAEAGDERLDRNLYGVAIVEAGSPVAIAGVFDTNGLAEIGVDVLRSHRGHGLGALVVELAASEIVARGDTAVYFCDAANIVSQRTALAAGFLPVSAIVVIAAGSG